MTGRPGHRTMEMTGGSSASYLTRTPCVPLFCTLLNRDGNKGVFILPGEGGDHFHCAVEPSPGHTRRRKNHPKPPSQEFSEIKAEHVTRISPKLHAFFGVPQMGV